MLFPICASVVMFCIFLFQIFVVVVIAIATAYMIFTGGHWYAWRFFKVDRMATEELNGRPQNNMNPSFLKTRHIVNKPKPTVDNSAEYFAKYFPKFKHKRMMIYSCTSYKSVCGGWGDRLRGLYSVYMLSVLQKRTFGIEITKPCTIEKFYRPNILDWRVPLNAFYGKQVGRSHFLHHHSPPYPVEEILAKIPDTDIVRVTFNQDYIDAFRFHKLGNKTFTFLKHLCHSEIRKIIYHGLFKLTDPLEEELNKFFDEQVGNHTLISAQIRVGDVISKKPRLYKEDLAKIWDFLLQYRNKSNCKIFIASDKQNVKEHAHYIFGDQFVGFNEPIIHIDQVRDRNKTACQGHRLSLLEFAVLARSDTLMLTRSGFGVEAAYLRPTSDNLYCFIVHLGITVPCTPESLKVIYGR